MKIYLISDNIDTLAGMRLAGIDGIVVHEKSEVSKAIENARNNPEIGVLLLTEKLSELVGDVVREMKLESRRPLLVEIPDRHGESNISANMEAFISSAVGMKFN